MFDAPWHLPENLSFWLSEIEAPWIVNIDLDYFFCQFEDGIRQMVSDEYVDAIGVALKAANDREVIGVFTLCLTPDSFAPGWAETETLAARLLDGIGLAFRLPEQAGEC